MISKTKKHSNLFLKYFIMYSISIIIMLLILGLFLNQFVITQFLAFSKNEYANILSTKCSQIDTELNALKTTAIRAQNLSVGTPYNICKDPSDKMKAIKELETLTAVNPWIENVALCYELEPDNIISVSGTMTVDSFARIYIDGNWDGKRLKDEMKKTTGSRILLTDSTYDNKTNPQQFLFIANMPFGQEKSYGYIVFVLDNSFLTGTLVDTLTNYDNFIQISDDSSQTYVVNSNTEKPALSHEKPQANLLSKDYIILTEQFHNTFDYTIGISKNQLYNEVEIIWRICIWVLVLFSGLGILISFLIAENFYRPIRKISEAIGAKTNSENELHFISNSISGLIAAKSNAENIIGDVKSQLFDNLLFHEIHDVNSITELLNFARVKFTYQYFCVVKLSPAPLLEEAILKQSDILDAHILHTVTMTDCVCFIINCAFNSSKSIRILLPELSNSMHISVGSVVSDIFKIHQSFEDATFVLTCNFFESQSPILTIEETIDKINNNYVYPKAEEAKLISAVISSNIEQTRKAAHNIFDKFNDEKVIPKVLWGIYVSMINNIKNAVETEQSGLIDMAYAIKNFIINDYSGYDELNNRFLDIIIQFITTTENYSENTKLIKSIYEYININFESYNISLNAVANHIGLSSSYTTKLFKESTGYSVKEYIDLKKTQRAKELLGQTELSLIEIAERTGFLDTQSFCRKFKSMEGITPNAYKRKSK